jgi:hypothetical protein
MTEKGKWCVLKTYQILYCIRPIGDINDSVLYYPYFGAFCGLIT